jgi:molybdopterin adenylyltransferase
MYRIAILTASDKGARGEREDRSGPAVAETIAALPGAQVVATAIVPDEIPQIEAALRRWVQEGIDLILTTGGTGMSPRDVTPEATRAVIERETPGFAEAMRAASLAVTPHAMLSRAVAGIAGHTLIVNLPGSPKAARENLLTILPALGHGLDKLKGDQADCAIS